MIAEALARTGMIDVVLIDFDRIKRHNLDRLLYASELDIGSKKVERLARRLEQIATAKPFKASAIDASVCDEEGLKVALDRPHGRHVLNGLAYAHLIPIVDGGISVRTNRSGTMASADWRAHIAAPGKVCLHCLGQYLASDVSLEREGLLDDPHYIEGLPKDHHLKANENVFAFSMACGSLQVLQFLAMIVAPLGRSDAGAQLYHFVGGFMESGVDDACHSECLMRSIIAIGDLHTIPTNPSRTCSEAPIKQPHGRRSIVHRFLSTIASGSIARLRNAYRLLRSGPQAVLRQLDD
jgi:hypothetical protein